MFISNGVGSNKINTYYHIIIKNQTELGVVGEELETGVVENPSSHSSSDSHSHDSEDSDDSQSQ